VNGAVSGVLLDLDGTLLDHAGAAAGAVAEWARTIPGWSGDDDEAVRLWRDLEARWFAVFTRGGCSFAEQRRRRVRGFHPSLADRDDEAADAVFADYLIRYEARWAAAPGAAGLIEHALRAGLTVGVLTNGDEQQQQRKLARIGLARPGLHLFASSALGVAKPDVRAFQLACAGLGTHPGETVMVGDDLATDVLGARAAGLAAVHLSRDDPAPGPWTVRSLAEVETLLLG